MVSFSTILLSLKEEIPMPVWGTVLLIIVIIVGVLVGLYFLGNKLQKKMDNQQTMINQHKMTTSILVIDKKKMKITEANLPKMVVDQVPKLYRMKKMPMVKAKIGPQITTLLCDNKLFKVLPTKKMIKVELAGIYIVGIKGNKNTKNKNNAPVNKKLTFREKLAQKMKKQ